MFLCFHSPSIKSQQQYSANELFSCQPTDSFLYTCNGLLSSCHSFLIFKPQPPYTTVTAIAALMSANPRHLARINNVSETAVLPPEKHVFIRVNCSCSDHYYQANTTFHITTQAKTYFVIANGTFQGLSTCGLLKHANRFNEFKLEDGFKLKIPLRCACPMKDQVVSGVKYLATYPIGYGDSVRDLAQRFNVTAESVLKANGLSETSTIFPFTTLLIPLRAEPSSAQTIIQRYMPETSVSSAKGSNKKKPLTVGIAAACSFLVFMAFLVTVLGVVYRRRKGQAEKNEEMMISPEDLLVEIASFEKIIKVFSFRELQKATKNFGPKCRIKGSVYRGVFGNQIIAVKKMGIDVSKQVNMLSKIYHFNLLKLYGFCTHKDSSYLVFEYMTMGSLREWLGRQRSEETHGLCTRVQIAMDVAHGLQYLHNFTKPGYVHKNINSSNILLDSNLRAKISNFSLARTTNNGNDISALSTIMGTRGFMAPEYVGNGCVTSKVDVYSFGVVMMELVSGKEAVVREGGHEVLLSTAIATIMEGKNAETELRSITDLANEENGSMEYAMQMRGYKGI
ncbi:Concanavalin A-like lectin/glucanase, subgroup [Cynara cardunculus var. scolymus]|uniref:Concanavalin A-like lectin/glucanase, subgroup n=1 Tax=Cynara cardunculus var. scolymus TaxID=59895 RepID=A0A103XWW6_CYNCS|nr:Concanavalin A-like lectin/glucanase, subgroup [Cynara cardunculus var. scolymus]